MKTINGLQIKKTGTFGHTDRYDIVGDCTPYTYEQLLDMCDPCNFGGYVRKTNNGATATIYTD